MSTDNSKHDFQMKKWTTIYFYYGIYYEDTELSMGHKTYTNFPTPFSNNATALASVTSLIASTIALLSF